MSADGTQALIGGPQDGPCGTEHCRGAAWVYAAADGGGWVEQQKLSEAGTSELGSELDMAAGGNAALLGGVGEGARLFSDAGVGWSEQETIEPENPEHEKQPVQSFALSADGTEALLGGSQEAWAYTGSSGLLSDTQRLISPISEVDDYGDETLAAFGSAVALSGDGRADLITGNPSLFDTERAGSVWAYEPGAAVDLVDEPASSTRETTAKFESQRRNKGLISNARSMGASSPRAPRRSHTPGSRMAPTPSACASSVCAGSR